MNHATNFFIYIIFLSSFRKTTLEMFSWFFVKITTVQRIMYVEF